MVSWIRPRRILNFVALKPSIVNWAIEVAGSNISPAFSHDYNTTYTIANSNTIRLRATNTIVNSNTIRLKATNTIANSNTIRLKAKNTIAIFDTIQPKAKNTITK